ncbi:MAG: ATP-dependent protease subunit HslV [Eubacteriales bacterium]|nr:ATP-dependent protease subunit HslV [Eubacteriales bacterium]MCI6028637.1 ATP-dependent protease subunit HslV [Clostridiales bacterium]MDD7414960.1 ATP-dependent protease subunit HslV [Clostridiales bacterium]MDY5731611.1 ATP-dependent protease subunit HslV [Eubacteriales bacterium]
MMKFEGTTIVAVRKDGKCAIAGDGQVTFGESAIMKHTAKKVRRLYHDRVVVGFAGTVADAFSLCERFEAKLEQYSGSLRRAAVSLAQDWRSDKALRQLQALLIAANEEDLLIISGTGEVIDPDDGIAAIGSGGMYALAAARALKQNTALDAREIAQKAILIASDICVYTNSNITVEEI